MIVGLFKKLSKTLNAEEAMLNEAQSIMDNANAVLAKFQNEVVLA